MAPQPPIAGISGPTPLSRNDSSNSRNLAPKPTVTTPATGPSMTADGGRPLQPAPTGFGSFNAQGPSRPPEPVMPIMGAQYDPNQLYQLFAHQSWQQQQMLCMQAQMYDQIRQAQQQMLYMQEQFFNQARHFQHQMMADMAQRHQWHQQPPLPTSRPLHPKPPRPDAPAPAARAAEERPVDLTADEPGDIAAKASVSREKSTSNQSGPDTPMTYDQASPTNDHEKPSNDQDSQQEQSGVEPSSAPRQVALTPPAQTTRDSTAPILYAPPPERTFPSFEVALDFLDKWAALRGYVVRCETSKHALEETGEKRVWYAIYVCDQAESRQRVKDEDSTRPGTREEPCKARYCLSGSSTDPSAEWTLKTLVAEHSGPGHRSPTPAVQHPSFRRRARGGVRQLIWDDMDQGLSPAATLAHIFSDHGADFPITKSDISNERARRKRESLRMSQ